MTFTDFVAEWNGNLCCNGGLCECVALVNQWCTENGWAKPQGTTAATLIFPNDFTRLTALSTISAGDILVFNSRLPGSNGDGHTCIATGRSYESFDQNWFGPNAAITQHTVGDFGYLSAVWRGPVAVPVPDPVEDDVMPKEVITTPVTVSAPGSYDVAIDVNPNLVLAWAAVRECGGGAASGTLVYVSRATGQVLKSVAVSLANGAGTELSCDDQTEVGAFVYQHGSGTVSVAAKVGTK